MLAPVRDPQLATIVRHHHERIDGSGYPDGLEGDQIPLGARIIAVADTFDAITSHRPYRRARSQDDALAVLGSEAGTLLDADVVEAFVRTYSPRRSIASMSLSTAVSARLATGLLPGGLLGGASLAGVLPAIGAAGLLAVAPDARYERAGAAAAGPAALQTAFPGALDSSGRSGVPVGTGHARARVGPLGVRSPARLDARPVRRRPAPRHRERSVCNRRPTRPARPGRAAPPARSSCPKRPCRRSCKRRRR